MGSYTLKQYQMWVEVTAKSAIDFVIPVFNEEESLCELFDRIKLVMHGLSIENFKVYFYF